MMKEEFKFKYPCDGIHKIICGCGKVIYICFSDSVSHIPTKEELIKEDMKEELYN